MPKNTVLCTCDETRMILVFEVEVPDPYDFPAITFACEKARNIEADCQMPSVTPSLVLHEPLVIRKDFR